VTEEGILIVQAKVDYVESYNKAVDIVARERKYLMTTEGFSLESTRSFVETVVKNNWAQFYAVNNGTVIGWCDILPRNFEGVRHVGILGIEKVELEVFESNENAVKFYQKHGFFQEGRRVKARKLNGQYDNIILMGKFI
jgi:hypothetical protein